MLLRRNLHLSTALVALTLAACGRSNRESQEAPGSAPPAAEAPVAAEARPAPVCDEEHREAVRQELQDMCFWSASQTVEDVPLSPWGGTPHGGFSDVDIAVGRDHFRVLAMGEGADTPIGEGNPLDVQAPIALADLAATLASIPPRRGHNGEAHALVWSLQIASDVPTSVVADVLQTLFNANLEVGQIMLRTSEEPAAVRDPVLHATLNRSREKVAPASRVAWAKQELERSTGPCLSYKDTFEAVSVVTPGQACWALSAGLFVAINDCGCEREAEILTVMYTVVFGSEPPKNRLTPIRTRISPNAKPLRGNNWASIVAGLEKDEVLSLPVAEK